MSGVDLQTSRLSEDERQQLQRWLVAFESDWEETLLAVRAAQLPAGDASLRFSLLLGMACIDLRQRWQRGQAVTVESYLKDYPELGSPDTVPTELIREECEARRQHGVPAEPAEFARRFPGRAGMLWPHLEPTRQLSAASVAEAETQAPPLSTSSPPPPASLPESFGRYRILRQLGRGGMGTVYLAQDTQLDRLVALKVPRIQTDDPTALERFYREARIAATLDHPNLCPIHDVGQHEGIPYLTMPFIEGKPLSASLSTDPPAPQRQTAALVRQLALALDEAHRRGIIHRDLKPSNIMLNRRGEPVIMDFGLARQTQAAEARLTQSGAILGTPAYMPPEQVDDATNLLGPPCDIYSLGVILYELLTGRLPFQGGTTQVLCQVLRDEPRRPSAYRPDLDPRLEAICCKAMAKRISERYRSMAELAAVLEQFLQTPEALDPPTVELAPTEELLPLPPVRARQTSERGQRDPIESETIPEVLPVGPPVTKRRRRRWPGVLLGCLTSFLFCCGGPFLVLEFLVPKAGEKFQHGVQWVGGEISRQSEWNHLAARWQPPPADVELEELFPSRLGQFERGTMGKGNILPEYNLGAEGRKCLYRSGTGEVELYALKATSLEREAIFKRLLENIEKRPHSQRSIQGTTESYQMNFALGQPDEKGMLWWNQGWLFIGFSRQGIEVEALLRTYLDLISRERRGR